MYCVTLYVEAPDGRRGETTVEFSDDAADVETRADAVEAARLRVDGYGGRTLDVRDVSRE